LCSCNAQIRFHLSMFSQRFVHSILSHLFHHFPLSLEIEYIVLYRNIDKKLVNSLHGLLNCEIDGLECHVITIEYRIRVYCMHMYHLFCNALVHVIYSVVSGQFSYTMRVTEREFFKSRGHDD